MSVLTLVANGFTDGQQMVGGQPGGWFITYGWGKYGDPHMLNARKVETPGVIEFSNNPDGYPLVRPTGTRTAGVQAADEFQRLFVIADPGYPNDYQLFEVFVDEVYGPQFIYLTGDIPRKTYYQQHASGDGLEYILIGFGADTYVYAYSTDDGSPVWSYNHAGKGGIPDVFPSAGLALMYTGNGFRLNNSAGTMLDFEPYDTDGSIVMSTLSDSNVVAVDMKDDGTTIKVANISCAGNVVTIGTWVTYVTGWGNSMTVDVARVGSMGDRAVIGVGNWLDEPYQSISALLSVPSRPSLKAGDASTLLGPGADVVVMAGMDYMVYMPFNSGIDNNTSTWLITDIIDVAAITALRMTQRNDGYGATQAHPRIDGGSLKSSSANGARIFNIGNGTYR